MSTTKATVIKRMNKENALININGTAPLVMHKFSQKARRQMMEKQAAGSTAKKGTKRDARDFEREVREAIHFAAGGWVGIPASAFRSAMISACRLVGFKMTLAKLSLFVNADGFDVDDGTPLVRLNAGEPEICEMIGRTETGVAMPVIRPMWREWAATVNISWDGDQFTADDVVNLMDRVGNQVGLLEGRPDSKNSAGLGWGTFEVVQ